MKTLTIGGSLVLFVFFDCLISCFGWGNLDRRSSILSVPAIFSAPTISSARGAVAASADVAARLAERDPALLENRLFNLPPSPQVYPEWLRGKWRVQSRFAGFILPSQAIAKEKVVASPTVAGFQKCSIASLADIGKDDVEYDWSVDPKTGFEDRATTLQSQIDAYLGYKAVQSVSYNVQRNPNRLSINFVEYRTTNAERIELFCNAREQQASDGIFVCAEYVRQVTFGTGSDYGVPRQVVTNYANFWTWNENGSGNLLTTAYLDPQDPLYFSEPKRPVVVYSHELRRRAL